MSEKIFLTYTNATAVPYQGSVLGYHIVLNYIDSNGRHHTLEGVPKNGFHHNIDKLVATGSEEIVSDGVKNTDSPLQRLQAQASESRGASLNQPHTMVAEGDDLSSRWALMEGFADEVNSIGYEYRPISQNSNSFAGGALERAGFFGPGTEFPERRDRQLVFDPVRGETKSLSVPGFEKSLANPINTTTPMPFPLSAPAASAVPTDGIPAPNRANSSGSRLEKRSAVPVDGLGDTRSPVLRELEKYRRSPAPESRVSTSIREAPTPAFQPDAVYSPAGDFFGNFPSEGTSYGDQLGNASGGMRPDTYSQLRSRTVSSSVSGLTPRNLEPLEPLPKRAPLLGIVSGKPMLFLPPQVWGLPDSDTPSNGSLLDLLAGLARNPALPAPRPQDDEARGFDREDQAQPWFIQRQR